MLWSRPEFRVLFVCTENVCRSPMAESMLLHRLESEGLKRRIGVTSAGTHVTNRGQRPDPRVQQVLADAGCPLVRTRASQVTDRDLERNDLVLAMEPSQVDALHAIREMPDGARVALVMDYAPGQAGSAVPDPYYGNRHSFEQVHEMLTVALDGLLVELAASLPD